MSETFAYGNKTVFKIGSTAVGNVISIGDLSVERAKIATDVLGDTIKKTRPANKAEVADMDLTVQYHPATHGTVLVDWAQAGTVQAVSVEIWSDAQAALETWSNAAAYARAYKLQGIKEDGNVELSITLSFNAEWTQA